MITEQKGGFEWTAILRPDSVKLEGYGGSLRVRIAIIGAGSVGRALGHVWSKAGHEIIWGLRNPQQDKNQDLPGERLTVEEAPKGADITVLAIPFDQVDGAAKAIGADFSGILVDCTNPINEAWNGLDTRGAVSGAAYVKTQLPRARMVKAFNQMGAGTMADAAFGSGQPLNLVCSSDEAAASCVRQLSDELGFDTVVVRGLEHARQLEEMAWLWISLAVKQEHGPDFAFAMVRR
ncbi:MAG: NAD(P)-binding domain-containing protein [Pseudomonadota bacterium]